MSNLIYSNETIDMPSSQYYLPTEFQESIPYNESDFSILHVNARSLFKNFDALQELLAVTRYNFSIICVTETWLNDKSPALFNIENYSLLHIDRKEMKGGGVAVYINNSLQYKTRKDLCFKTTCAESLFIEVENQSSKNSIFGVVYRPPHLNIDTFIEDLDEMLQKVSLENKDTYLGGDFNIDLIKSNRFSQTFVNLMDTYALSPFINKATRISSSSSTLIDNIFSNTVNRHVASGIIYSDLSDHLPIFVIVRGIEKLNKSYQEIPLFRKMTQENIQNLQCDLEKESWENVLSCSDVNEAYKLFLEKIHNYLDRNIPKEKNKNKSKTPRNPWITRGILRSIKKRNKLYKINLENPSQNNLTKYKNYRNKLTSIIRASKQLYFSRRFENTRGNMSATWKNIHDVLGKSKHMNLNRTYHNGDRVYDNPEDIVNGFNDYFANVGKEQASKIPNSKKHFKDFLRGSCNFSLFLHPTNQEEVYKIVNSFKNKKSYGHDEISNYLLKLIIPYIINPLVHICNISLLSGIFPSSMKIAKVIPIHKKDDHTLMSNYRPVSILSSFSKILERIVHNRLSKFLTSHNLLNSSQYGFRKCHSTDLALIDLYDKISNTLAKKQSIISVFMDLSKAFDTLDHSILIYKLQHYGIRGTALKWFKSYISGRRQFTYINSVCSSTQYIYHGVPQGSILGPLLFLIYVNDIVNSSTSLNFILFADDTTVTCSNTTIETLYDTLNRELPNISCWFKSNRLSLNLQKTHFIHFKGSRIATNDYNGTLEIDGIKIAKKKNVTFLGVVINEFLSWDEHILKISIAISRCIGILAKLRHCLPLWTLINIYNSILLPHITYCNIVWGMFKSKNNQLYLLQKKAIRLCAGGGFRDPTDPLFFRFKTLKVDDINTLQIALFMYRFQSNQLPETFDNIFRLNSAIHKYPTRISTDIHLFNPVTKLAHRSIRHAGPDTWNSIPLNVRRSLTISSFKLELKKTILIKYLQ